MDFKNVSQENIGNMVRKGLNIKTREFQPDEFSEFSFICSEDLIIMSIRVLSCLSNKLRLSDKFITDFLYPITQYEGADMSAIRLKFICVSLLAFDKEK